MSSEPRIDQSAGGIKCYSTHAGHNTFWMAAMKYGREKPFAPAKVVHVEGQQFTVTSMGRAWTYYFHDPEIVKSFIARRPDGFKHVLGAHYVTGETEHGRAWFNMSLEPVDECQTELLPDPRPYPNRRNVEELNNE